MKKIISILMVALMLLVSTNTVMAADDALDIEKVAIQSLKNSQDVQSVNRQVTLMQKNYADITAAVNGVRNGLRYMNSYQAVEFIILKPMEVQNSLTTFTNLQLVTTNAVRLSSYKAYIGLLKANYALTIQKGLMDSLDADYKKAQQQLSLGMISQSQLRLSEIAYLKSQYRHDSSQKSVNSASLLISNMMGEDLAKQYTLQDNNIIPAAQIKSLNDYVNIALGNRAEIVNAQSTLDTKKKEYDYGKAELPTDFQFYVQKQQYAIDSAQNDLDLAKINVQLDITNNYKALEYAMKTMEAMKYLDDQANFNYQTAQVQYDNSQITLKELGDAKVAKATADVNYKNAELDAWLAQTMMDTACGSGFQPSNILSSLSSSLNSSSSSKNNVNPTEKFNRANRN
ncbi:TolC family protein [Desulfosporosinus metallidurans]|uniref:Outer membrane protein n=1 Tax=Desulfosporosinus metallidurans TaxID=1888891 RepID=A0A1Q8QXS2_9FIRM|nr:TolC family protein [Desulfosporosinus metallidurans]OLN32128.1 Outer membrane protein [Desulfosporosinus metallidurans]